MFQLFSFKGSKVGLRYYFGGSILVLYYLGGLLKTWDHFIGEFWYIDFLSYWLIFLSVIIIKLRWTGEGAFGLRIFKLLSFIIRVLFFCLVVKTCFFFYFWFEVSLIPIFVIVLGWGYQPERLFAGKVLFLYTVFGSLPLLWTYVFFDGLSRAGEFYLTNYWSVGLGGHYYLFNTQSLFLVLAFLVKFPIYGVHLWLPKAHVEAPVGGSIILAGILLKLGGYGIYRRLRFLPGMGTTGNFIFFLRLIGGVWTRFLCIVQRDLKVLIAYSSVGHIRLSIRGLLRKTLFGVYASKLMLLCHGWVSGALFFGVHVFYTQRHSRNLYLTKGMLITMPGFCFLWSLICARNIGCPFSLRLFREILLFVVLLGFSFYTRVRLVLIGFLAACYRLLLYSYSSQGVLRTIKKTLFRIFRNRVLTGWVLMFYRFFVFIFILSLV